MFKTALVLGLLLTVSSQAQSQAPKVDRAAEKAIIEQTFRDYGSVFLTGDIKKVTSYYADPIMIIPIGKVMTLAEVGPWVEATRETARSRGIVEGVTERLEVKFLGDSVALVSFLTKRLNKDRAPVQVFAGTYYLRKTDDGWKIAVLHAFPPADYVKLD